MKTTLISNENNEAKFTMEFDAKEFDDAIEKAYQKNRNAYQIKGFRKGKAPRKLIESNYGSGIFYQDAIDSLFGEHYENTIDEFDLEVIDRPTVDFSEIAEHQPLTMTMTVALYPTDIEVKDYFGLEVDQTEIEFDDSEVDTQIENMRKRNARLEDVDRAAEMGDTVNLDFKGFMDGEQFDGGTAKDQNLKLGSNQFIPGFEEQLVGTTAGQDVDVKVTFPEDYGMEEFAGKDAHFECTVHAVKEEVLPELNDEFAQDVSEFDTVDELKEDLKKNIIDGKTKSAENEAKNNLVRLLVEKNEFDAPDSMVENEIDNMVREFDEQLRYSGMTFDQYMKMLNTDLNSFREQSRDAAIFRVKSRALLRAVAAKENIVATDDEVNEEIEKVAKQYQVTGDQLKGMMGKATMRLFTQDIAVQKAVDKMYEEAKVNMVEPKKPEEEKADAAETEKKDDAE